MDSAAGTEEEHRKEALERARRLSEGARKQCPEVEEGPEGELLGTGWKSRTAQRGQERVEGGKTASGGERRASGSRKQGSNNRRTRKGGQGGGGREES